MSKWNNECVKGFLHAEGTKFVNGDGEQVILRGMGVGNWTNPEGFMIGAKRMGAPTFADTTLRTPDRFDRGRTMYTTMVELCGRKYADEFEKRWYRAYLQEGDFKLMADFGYNSVRLPIGARMLLEEGPELVWNEDLLQHIDDILDWCEKYRIYAILDLHAAVAGQSGIGCDDGIDNMPRTFLEPESRERSMLIWEKLAERYKDRWIVGGYDILNEPLSTIMYHEQYDLLKDFYDECCARIRKIDKNHLFTLEGTLTSSTLGIFDHDYDPECHNWCIHMHHYGFSGDAEQIYPILYISKKLNVPVWYGEGGSTPQQDTVFYDMIAYYGWGWNQWTWKSAADPRVPAMRMSGVSYNNPLAFYEKIQPYFSEMAPRPSYKECCEIFDGVIENLKIENCQVNFTPAKYNLRNPGITVPAAGYMYGTPEDDFFSRNTYDGNAMSYRLEDHTRLVLKDGIIPKTCTSQTMSSNFGGGMPGFGPSALDQLLLELHAGDYTTYAVHDIKNESPVSLKARVLSDAVLKITVGNETCEVEVKKGDFDDIPVCVLQPSEDARVRIEVTSGEIQLDSITFGE